MKNRLRREMLPIEKTINGYYFEFGEQDGATILVEAFVTSTKPNATGNQLTNEKARIEALQNMFRNLSGLPGYIVFCGDPGKVMAHGTDFLATAVRGAVSRRDRSRITVEEVMGLVGNNLTPSSKK